jgi:hypothetical protein
MTENTNTQQLHRAKLVYVLEGHDPETVTVHNRSMIAWDETRGVRKWPKSSDAPSLWQTFLVWHHLNRRGEYTGDFNTFKDACEHIEMLDEDEPVDPTQPAATHDSSSPSE